MGRHPHAFGPRAPSMFGDMFHGQDCRWIPCDSVLGTAPLQANTFWHLDNIFYTDGTN